MKYLGLCLAFGGLALATPSGRTGALLIDGDEFSYAVDGDRCVNLRKDQPIFHYIEVLPNYGCAIYSNLKCDNEIDRFETGRSLVAHITFKSVRCTVTNMEI
ncbi:hypothetical protein NLG97_g7316 [Lecanicillium saksenae]|uniref:Uncharacterized protein n=1 Tax=Lecanicillium saksenae TaxID=468837 RepID=A0ACC1QP04_9HYPO|nr:hypothetical protein NLG97_g7316 [Lecanicillium saksenae]